MWAITNRTRFKASRAFARGPDGAEIWIVAVRATFTIGVDGRVALAEEQDDVCLTPKYFGAPGLSSLRYDIDLHRTKSGTDVVVHGSAHARHGIAVPSVDAGWSVGFLSKVLRVYGDRVWQKTWSGISPSEPVPFVSLPIKYERAWGGLLPECKAPDPLNTIGIGPDPRPGKPVPNIEHPAQPIHSPRHKGPPAGFGPIPSHWQPRAQFAGTYDDVWKRTRQPLVPADFNDAYFRCAPVDQQLSGFLQGGEQVVLRNLTPEGLLRFQLPRIALRFRTNIAHRTEEHGGELHTVVLEPEEHRLVMVWQTTLPCHHTLYTLKETVVYEKEVVPLGRTRYASTGG